MTPSQLAAAAAGKQGSSIRASGANDLRRLNASTVAPAPTAAPAPRF